MKVFFTTTPRLKNEFPGVVEAIYKSIDKFGHTSTSEYLKTVDVNDFYRLNNKKIPVYYDEVVDALRKADIVIFEASLHSIGVGMLIKEALELGKGVIILHQKEHYPFFLGGLKDERFVISEYSSATLDSVLEDAFEYLAGAVDVRFNFFISPKIGVYLDWVSKNKRIPRAVYLRKLIEEEMNNNSDYNESK